MDNFVDEWRQKVGSRYPFAPLIRSIDLWLTPPGEIHVSWIMNDDPTSTVGQRTYTLLYLKGVVESTDVNDAYDRAMRGI